MVYYDESGFPADNDTSTAIKDYFTHWDAKRKLKNVSNDGETYSPSTVDTEELSVSDNQPVTGGPVGNEGEWIPLQTSRVHEKAQTTSTTYSGAVLNGPWVNFDLAEYSKITNISELRLSAIAKIRQDTSGETVSLVLIEGGSQQIDGSEVTAGTGFNHIRTARVGIPSSGIAEIKYDIKVSGGTGSVFNGPELILWGKIA